MIATLGDMCQAVKASDVIPAAHKRALCWALTRTIVWIGNGLPDVRADPRTVLRQLDQLSPAMAGLSPRAFSNVKSLVRAAFRLLEPRLPPARSRVKLRGAWAALEALLSQKLQRDLSRFLRFAQSMGWAPHEISEEHVQRFADYLEREAMLVTADGVARATRYAWNRAVETVPGWPNQPVAPPPRKRTPYWLRLDELPLSLQQEIDAYMLRLAQPDPFLGQSARPLRPETLLQNRHYLVLLASALVHSGTPVEALTSIAVLVQPDNVQKALEYLYERAGRRMTAQIELLAWRARKFATDAGVPDEDVARLRELYARVVGAGPSRRGMTEKNRRLLDHLDDPAFVDRLVTLPFRLMAAARQMTASTPAASSARDAVAIEILMSCSMRVGNLIELRLGETIRKFGEGPRARWAIDIPGEKVKNGQPLRYSLLPESVQLLEDYLEHWHAQWCGPGSPWLFPAAQGGHVDRRYLSDSIAARAYRYVGVRITAHQFRHLAAELYLRTDPGGIAIVSQHLGHRDLNTTRHFYAREQSRIATERYHEVLIKKRAAVPTRRQRTRKPVGAA